MAPGTRTIDFLVALNRAVNGDVGYSVRMEPGVQAPDFTLQTGIGSCRDSAWLLVSILRELGLAARFVSGYLVQLSSDIEALDGPSGPAADFTDLHAWTEVYIPGAGWIGLDPTSGLFAGEGHIPLAATPHPSSAAPITGSTGMAEATLDFANIVTRVHEDPRVTLPYTDAAWAAINALGVRIDQRLTDADVRLTIGGEPTFVSVDNQVDEEWTIAADGPHKRERASCWPRSSRRCGRRAVWCSATRANGIPENRCRAGRSESTGVATASRCGATPRCLPTRGLPTTTRWTRSRPAGAGGARRGSRAAGQPGAPRVRGCAEPAGPGGPPALRRPRRTRRGSGNRHSGAARGLLARLEESVVDPAAYLLPVHRRDDDAGWASADWRLRRGRVVLLDGDSPAGLRLPLGSISWQPPRPSLPADPIASGRRTLPVGSRGADAAVDDADDAPTTAMVAEVREACSTSSCRPPRSWNTSST